MTLLPDDALPGVRQDLGTIAEIVSAYLDGQRGYRTLPFVVLGLKVPADLTVSTIWGQPEAPSPTPSTCFRWLARFAAGARSWWNEAAAALQAHGEYTPPVAPEHLHRQALSQTKCEALRWAWHATHAFSLLATQLSVPSHRWPFLMRHAPTLPRAIDRTGWFCKPPLPP